jgi:hypothetical protein
MDFHYDSEFALVKKHKEHHQFDGAMSPTCNFAWKGGLKFRAWGALPTKNYNKTLLKVNKVRFFCGAILGSLFKDCHRHLTLQEPLRTFLRKPNERWDDSRERNALERTKVHPFDVICPLFLR